MSVLRDSLREQPLPAPDSMLAGQLEKLARDGYVILESVLSAAEIGELVGALAPFERERPMGRNDFEGERSQRVYSLAGKGEVFMRLAEHAAVVAILDRLLLPNWLLSTLQSIRLHPGETAQPWHPDDVFYLIPRPRGILGISAIWALEPFTEENGATQLIPGSHLWADEHPDSREHDVVTAAMPAGSVLVFNAALWHRGGANRSSGTRLCISPQYCQPWLRPQESQLLIAPPEIAARYSERGRAMLGYSIHPPFIGQVDGKHPLRLIDPAYSAHKTEAAQIANRVLKRPTTEGI
jgi:ectoine hydroxylase-related dioxygenase (phytanoyl-CoA dioxygenase family)